MKLESVPKAKKITSKIFGGAAVVTMLFASGCASGGVSSVADDCKPVAEVTTVENGKLKALEVEHPPFVTMEGKNPTGVEGELVRKIAADLCLELDTQVTSFAGAIEGLQNNRADLSSANWSVNDERKELFEVSEPMYENSLGVVTQGQDWHTVDDLDGKKIGTPQGYLWNEDLKALYGDNVSEYQSDVAVMDDIKAGRLDAGFVNNHANSWRIATLDQYKDLTLTAMDADPRLPYTQEARYAVALIQKGNTQLVKAVNSILQDYKESGEMEAQFEKNGLDAQAIVAGKS